MVSKCIEYIWKFSGIERYWKRSIKTLLLGPMPKYLSELLARLILEISWILKQESPFLKLYTSLILERLTGISCRRRHKFVRFYQAACHLAVTLTHICSNGLLFVQIWNCILSRATWGLWCSSRASSSRHVTKVLQSTFIGIIDYRRSSNRCNKDTALPFETSCIGSALDSLGSLHLFHYSFVKYWLSYYYFNKHRFQPKPDLCYRRHDQYPTPL